MTITTDTASGCDPAGVPAGLLGPWVEAREEPCRGGRTYRVLVNHRTGQAMELTDAEAALCSQQATSCRTSETASPEAAALLADLGEQGFLAASPPQPLPRRTLTVSLSRLDVRWNSAGRLVRAAHDHGARHLFHPVAVAAQAVLALAGLAALAVTVSSGQHFQLRVHPAQVPLVIAVSLAAIGVHEFAHALVVVHHRRTVDAAGVRLHLGTPAFYVESASALLLPRRQRLIQAAAGVWAEWLFTSLVALWLWRSPLPFAIPLLHRFVILNAATIATNLAPFTGLDGSWILADALRAPDLGRRCHGAPARVLLAWAGGQPATAEDRALAAYATVNSIVAAALLATAGFFWYQLFGDLAATLAHHGPAGWLALAALGVILGRPVVTAAAARLPAGVQAAREIRSAIVFRLQWRWRIPATRHLAAAIPQFAGFSGQQLGFLAGHLHRTRIRCVRAGDARAASYGMVAAGNLTALTAGREPVILSRGATWNLGHQLVRAARGTIVIYVDATVVRQLLGPALGTP